MSSLFFILFDKKENILFPAHLLCYYLINGKPGFYKQSIAD